MSEYERQESEAASESPTLPKETTLKYEKESDEAIVAQEEKRVTTKESSDSVNAKARESAVALKDLVISLASKTKATAAEKAQQLKEAANDERPMMQSDAADIQRLGSLVDAIALNFEETMDDIAKAPYDEQAKLLLGYKKVLNEELNVINARLAMATRLRSPSIDSA